jgi:nitrate/nitrite transporter NarK
VLARATTAGNRNIVFSVKQTGVPLGFMIAAVSLPNLALAFGWRTTCLCVAAALAAAALMLAPVGRHLDAGGGQAVRFSPRVQFAEPLLRVWRQAEMRNISFASFAYSGLQGSLASFMVVFLLHETALDLVAAASVLACAQAAGAGGRIVWGFVADRSGRPDVVLAALGAAMAVFALVVALGAARMPHAALVAAAVLFGGTAMAWNGVFLGEVARLAAPGRAGEATGATGLFTFGGVAIVPGLYTTIVLLTESYVAAYLVAATLPGGVGIALLRAARAAGISKR